MKELQELVIGWDNIPEALKNELSTASEVVTNADYLIHAADVVMEKLQVSQCIWCRNTNATTGARSDSQSVAG